ncbi:hypothetical protein [Cytobacillus gottheilii]|uniref:hypothetical protein n=1 Tax=Cytobacillus gottheilii TaxID=859144 RepID=UPI0009BABF91|nr:hypothetical protein [Cytobacillus gottheilii]
MKDKFTWLITIIGFLLLITGIILTIVGSEVLDIHFVRNDLVPIGLVGSGFMLLFGGIMVILDKKYKTKEDSIQENDERNIRIKQSAKAKAFDLLIVLFCFGLFTLALFGYMNKTSFFSLLGLYLLVIFYYLYQFVINKRSM